MDQAKKKRRCPQCFAPLWTVDNAGPRRFPLADYIAKRHTGYFDLTIIDEMHEYKGKGSAQGYAAAALTAAAKRVMPLTGTIFGGYSSTLFHLLWRFSRAVRAEFGHNDDQRWVSRYGIIERITKKDDDFTEDGRSSKRKAFATRTIERPGITPAVLTHLLPNTIFVRLADVARDLPPYTESVRFVPMAPDQAKEYHQLAEDLYAAVVQALAHGSKRLLGAYLQTLLSYPDNCTVPAMVADPRTEQVIATARGLPADVLYPKERQLIDLIQDNKRRGRRVWVYVTHTETRDITPRLKRILEDAGLRVAVLKSDTVPADKREDWVARQVAAGVDAVLSHPKLVQTGLDLLDFPSIHHHELEYSIYVVRQASRRSWRVGATQPVEVTFSVYEDTLQAQALALIAAKMRAALMIDGDIPDEGLSVLGGAGQDLFLALAQKIAQHAHTDDDLDALLAGAQAAEREDNKLLGDFLPPEADLITISAQPVPPAAVESDAARSTQHAALPSRQLSLVDAVQQVIETTTDAAGSKQLTLEEMARAFLATARPSKRASRPAPAAGQLSLFAG